MIPVCKRDDRGKCRQVDRSLAKTRSKSRRVGHSSSAALLLYSATTQLTLPRTSRSSTCGDRMSSPIQTMGKATLDGDAN